ncbi:MAG: mRNA surveillance protein pelota [Candidatus Anstonellales archaeon]
MRVNYSHIKEGKIRIIPENAEDLWHIGSILNIGDRVFSKTWRRFKPTEDDAGEKMPVNIELEAEKVEFSEELNRLRVTGKIISGEPEEYAPRGQYHTVDVETGFPIVIQKDWKEHELQRLKKAVMDSKKPKVIIVVLDNEKALFATLTGRGVHYDFEIESKASKRDERFAEKEREYFDEILKKVQERKEERIVIAGPGFTKDNLKKFIMHKDPQLLKKIVFDSVSYAERSGVEELLSRGAISKAIVEHEIERNAAIMNKFMEHVGREDGLCAWGLDEVKRAMEYGAVSELLVLDSLLRKRKDVSELVEKAVLMKVNLHVFSSGCSPAEKLDGFGGLAAILRFRIE